MEIRGYYVSKLTEEHYVLLGGAVVALNRVIVEMQEILPPTHEGTFLFRLGKSIYPSVRHLADNFEFVDERLRFDPKSA